MAKKKHLWMAQINLSGLYSNSPLKMTWDDDLEKYWDYRGDLSVEGVGLYADAGCITFASYKSLEVQLWISGVLSTMKMMQAWCSGD